MSLHREVVYLTVAYILINISMICATVLTMLNIYMKPFYLAYDMKYCEIRG